MRTAVTSLQIRLVRARRTLLEWVASLRDAQECTTDRITYAQLSRAICFLDFHGEFHSASERLKGHCGFHRFLGSFHLYPTRNFLALPRQCTGIFRLIIEGVAILIPLMVLDLHEALKMLLDLGERILLLPRELIDGSLTPLPAPLSIP